MEKITERELEILNILKREPMIAQEELASRLTISRSAAAVHISNLMKKGFILGRGYVFNDRTGVVVIGGAETICEVKANTASTQSSVRGNIGFELGGTALKIAVALSHMNLPVIMMTALGKDDEGDLLLKKIKSSGVDTNHIIRTHKSPSAKLMHLTGIQDKHAITIESRDIMGLISTRYIWQKEHILNNCSYIFIDSMLKQDTFMEIAKIATEAQIPLAYKPSAGFIASDLRQNLDKITLLVVTPEDCAKLTGQQIREMDDALSAAGKLVAAGVNNVVVAVGEHGVVMASEDEILPLQSMPTQIVDLSLHSDTLMAGIMYALVNGYNYRQAIRIGMRTAAVSAQTQNAEEQLLTEETA